MTGLPNHGLPSGDFFLTAPDTYEMRWRSVGAPPFQVMHLYLSVPLFERVAYDVLGCAASPALRDFPAAGTRSCHIDCARSSGIDR